MQSQCIYRNRTKKANIRTKRMPLELSVPPTEADGAFAGEDADFIGELATGRFATGADTGDIFGEDVGVEDSEGGVEGACAEASRFKKKLEAGGRRFPAKK
jgi:hypothetical protein